MPSSRLQAFKLFKNSHFHTFPLNFRSMICYQLCVYVCVTHSVVSDSLQSHGLKATRLLCPWNSPGMNTGVGSLSLLQGIFPIQGLNWGLLHCRWILYQLSYQGSPVMSILIMKSFLMIQIHPSFSFLLITDSPAFATVNKFIQIRT